jgi:hypothetical protein
MQKHPNKSYLSNFYTPKVVRHPFLSKSSPEFLSCFGSSDSSLTRCAMKAEGGPGSRQRSARRSPARSSTGVTLGSREVWLTGRCSRAETTHLWKRWTLWDVHHENMVIFYSYGNIWLFSIVMKIELMDNDGLTYSHVEMAHRNRWFTELKNGDFPLLNNQMVMDNHL